MSCLPVALVLRSAIPKGDQLCTTYTIKSSNFVLSASSTLPLSSLHVCSENALLPRPNATCQATADLVLNHATRGQQSRSGSRRREYLLDPSPPNVVVKASKKKAVKHAVGLEEAEQDMAEQVARSTLERQLRSARRDVRRKEEVDVSEAASGPPLTPRSSHRTFPRWMVGRLNRERAEEVAVVQVWCTDSTPVASVEEGVRSLQRSMMEVCNASMPKWRPPPQRMAIYWLIE
ncbi:unnamed protein product [Pieris brassicae]|uniref:Uncharacterized protein n=1 Tax=Pieris brassicae TaxID=7116 RepID=A0A9P0TTH8_PIEBR|nr:unnamed protein product [Pieris brassicae]